MVQPPCTLFTWHSFEFTPTASTLTDAQACSQCSMILRHRALCSQGTRTRACRQFGFAPQDCVAYRQVGTKLYSQVAGVPDALLCHDTVSPATPCAVWPQNIDT